ncbi:hypothetical protein H257_08941 [Aphanomyces astaci]|uniref:Glucose-methanol-choline oxidoreductase N-terminal domain-containing protein n=1 Tax=Aphanomyces astaci TaxID=112090 RepID=W4GBI6_APHAT|nr:hypothetical protein H257_08941 [Aphanomyces astaci]ETV77025.1 hypothetical protein H257_08941 [Aphanomyces astaci]RQM29941.1 hypothetical protein B5M09_012592 [Aphanomyces astaci]|eukprot:XP_009833331.1 hypothetical protein H257_08941 [Aphanomyces astaci]
MMMTCLHRHVAGGILVAAVLAATAHANEVYDVVIIGSGPGGLVAAEYLTRDPSVSVLVLEAGVSSLKATGGDNIPDYIRSEGWTVFDIPGEYSSVAFPSDNNGRYRIDWVTSPGPLYLGKVVGGSSSMNGMLYFHTADSYVDESKWPYDAATVNANYDAIETSFSSTNLPSTDGKWYLQEAYNLLRDGLRSQGGYREVDINAQRNAKSKSFGHPPFTIKNGLRDSPAKTFYGAASTRANFKLVSSALALRIAQSQGKATGVVYSFNGQLVTATLSGRGSVIVAAGAVSTPKVLIQSGIGPQSQLNLLASNANFPGITTNSTNWVVNNNVGNHLFDTIQVLTTFKHPTMKVFNHGSRPQAAIDQYVTQNHTGPWASPDPVLVGYEYSSGGNQFQITGFCHGFNFGSNDLTEFGVAVYLNNPRSRTKCEFKEDGTYHFNLDSNLYTNADDVAAMDQFSSKLQMYMEQAGSTFVQRRGKDGANHYGGTCIPSNDVSDATRCADGTFKVLGTSNIFVGDASLMREGTVNPYGFTMQIGRQAGLNVHKFLSSSVPPPTCSAIEENTDYFGNNVGSSKRSTAAECCRDCAAHPSCKLYVWFEGTCWLKSVAGPKSSQPGRRAAVLQTTSTPPPPTCSAIEDSTDYTGTDIGAVPRNSADLCCADCLAKAGCTVFVWYQGWCYLKATTGTKVPNATGRRAGLIVTTKPPTTCSSIENDVDYYGNDIGRTQRSTAESCCDDCKNFPGCKLFTFAWGTCWLKNVKGAAVAAPGARAGFVDSNAA